MRRPPAMVAHTRRRADYNDIVKMFYDVQPDVIMGGGSPNFLRQVDSRAPSAATRRTTSAKFEGRRLHVRATNDRDDAASVDGKTSKLLGLFNTGNIDGALDRFFLKKGTVEQISRPAGPDRPGAGRARRSCRRHDKGFVLMVESGRIDKYSHSLDWERAVYDTIMLDNAVKVGQGLRRGSATTR